MAEEFLEEIYRKSKHLEELHEFVDLCRTRDFIYAVRKWNALAVSLADFCKECYADNPQMAAAIVHAAKKIKESGYDLVAWDEVTTYEIIPLMHRYLGGLANIDVEENGYRLKSTRSGYLTIGDAQGHFFNSLTDPMMEAKRLAEYLFNYKLDEYHIIGTELGYLAYQLWKLSHGTVIIHIYENNPTLIEYAYNYGVLDWIPEENLDVQIIENKEKLLYKMLLDIKGKPSDSAYRMQSKKAEFEGLLGGDIDHIFNNNDVLRRFENAWEINLKMNSKIPSKSVLELIKKDYPKEWVVVAAGPSLNDNIEFLRESQGKRAIVVVNTVIRRMKSENIKPDIVTVLDPSDVLEDHIIGSEEFTEDIPIIASRIASNRFLSKYRGQLYYAPCDYHPDTIRECVENNMELWSVNGTVTSLALETALKFGAEKIYLIGCDMGYPNNVSYASGVSQEAKTYSESEFTLRANDGSQVGSGIVFKGFKDQLEYQISQYPDVRVVNLSEKGAYIKGSYVGEWFEETDFVNGDINSLCDKLMTDTFLTWREKYYCMRQMIDSADELASDVESKLEELFELLYKEFSEEFGSIFTVEEREIASSGLTFMLFSGGKADSKINLKLWEKLHVVDNRSALIVDSEEVLGGEEVPTVNKIAKDYPMERMDEEVISIYGTNYAYYQFGQGMPNHEYYAEFMKFFVRNIPNKVYASDKFSILAKLVSEIVPVEYV